MPACTSNVLAPSSMSPFDRSATAFVSDTPDSAWECGIPMFAAAFIISELLSECICMQRFVRVEMISPVGVFQLILRVVETCVLVLTVRL